MHRFSRFIVVGIIGFLVDAGVLSLALQWAHVGLYLGRLVSFLTAATATWYLNRVFTYRDRVVADGHSRQWMCYLSVSSLGAAINYLVYCGLVATLPYATRHPTFGVAAGSVASLAVNFNLYTRLVFRSYPVVTFVSDSGGRHQNADSDDAAPV